MITHYFVLSKPGIVLGNTLALLTGFLFAAFDGTDGLTWWGLAGSIVGTGLVMASACAYNNLLDADIDALMPRTSRRAVVTGAISTRSAALFSVACLYLGVLILYLTTPALVPFIALFAWGLYAILYTRLKRTTYHAALLGAVPGAAPPVIGYLAAHGNSVVVALVLFVIVMCWQMMHFYAIALMRRNEYKAASIPVIAVVKDESATRHHIDWWTFGLVICLLLSTSLGPVSYAWLAGAVSVWLLRHICTPGELSARSLFLKSLQFLPIWFLAVASAAILA